MAHIGTTGRLLRGLQQPPGLHPQHVGQPHNRPERGRPPPLNHRVQRNAGRFCRLSKLAPSHSLPLDLALQVSAEAREHGLNGLVDRVSHPSTVEFRSGVCRIRYTAVPTDLAGSSSRPFERCRFLIVFSLFAVGTPGCAGLLSGNAQPVCRPDTQLLGPLQKAQNDEACRNEEIVRESDELEARMRTEVAAAKAQAELDEELQKQGVAEATAAYAAQREASARAGRTAEADQFQSMLVIAADLGTACEEGELGRDDYGKAVSTRAYLLAFESSSERDSALSGLEPCRGDIEKGTRAYLPSWLAEKRDAFAREVEENFDAANPVRQGALKAKVNGRTLKVRLPKRFEGRARHSETQVKLNGLAPSCSPESRLSRRATERSRANRRAR